ncbi:MAG TPA: ATP-binding protein [Candidatus Megaira endosymbiont of Nemacystus decipiens]|nr:ATP-binding protein [Candidatus Megaera endosymbiont of Nemacystus decipiens]
MIQNKHIIRLSFIGLFLNIIANIILYRYFMIEEVVINQIAENNKYLVKTYQEDVWNKNKTAIEEINSFNYKQFFTDKQLIDYARKSIDFFKNINSTINIYNKYGHKVISTNNDKNQTYAISNRFDFYNFLVHKLDSFFLGKYTSSTPITDAYRGKVSHSLVSRNLMYYDDIPLVKSFINSYVPIISATNGKFAVDGVIEIITDITDQWEDIIYLEKRAVIIFVVIFFVFFTIVMYNTNYAQRIINKQFETNRALKEEKARVQIESSAKTDFLANVSHELRTPLNAIIGFSEIILSETYGKIENKHYQDYVNDINNSGKHLLSVINDILDFSKASADKLKVENVELDLNKLASSSMRFVQPRASSANIELIEDLPRSHVVITADPKRLKQALLNLLSNAVKFTPSGGAVTLRVVKNKSKELIDIIVSDNGIGMDEKQIPKALSSFGQVDNKLSRKYEGTGLGLPLTKKLVELMDGKFSITSKKGKGTKITITFKYDPKIQF